MPVLTVAALALSSAPAYAGRGDQLAKLLANDGAARDLFGDSVAISGDIALVGACGNDDFGSDSGSAYLFDISDPENPTQLAKLLPLGDAARDDRFGWSVAISGETAIVVAFGDDDNGSDSGSAFVFDISDPTTPVLVSKILPDDGQAGDGFGGWVAASGSTVIFGALGDDDNGADSGSAYLFDISEPANPVQMAKLLPSDGASEDFFGRSVGIDGSIAIVGAWGNDDLGFESGSVYLFDVATGDQIAKFLPNDGANGDQFGISVAISGDIAIVGANGDDDRGSSSGSAYLLGISDPANPAQLFKLVPDDGGGGDEFGWVVAIDGDTALVAAPGDNDHGSDSGSAYLIEISDPEDPALISKLLADDGAGGDRFGFSFAIDGSIVIVGALDHDDNGSRSGSAYLFDADNSGDLNCDGRIDAFDIEPFLLALFDADEYEMRFPNCDINRGDINGDGTINAFDIEPFLGLLFP